MVKSIILDRDGTLVSDNGYVHKVEDFELLPGVIEGLKLLSKDFIFIVITNQSGVGRGEYTKEDMHKFNEKLISELKKENIGIKKIYFCLHIPEDNCDCRKPKTKNIEHAKKDFNIDMEKSWVIGDHLSDVELGKRVGARAVYLLTGHGKKHSEDLTKNIIKPDFIANNFLEAAEFIMRNSI